MKRAQWSGQEYVFDDNVDDEIIASYMDEISRTPTIQEVNATMRGHLQRQGASAINAAVRLGKDIFRQDTSQEDAVSREITQARREEELPNMSLFQQAWLGAPLSLITTAPAMLTGPVGAWRLMARGVPKAAATSRATVASVAGASAPTGLQTYGESREAGFSGPRSAMHAFVDYGAEVLTEVGPLSAVLGSRGKGFWSTLKRYGGRELFGEAIATTIQDINAHFSYRPDITMKDYLEDLAVTAMTVGLTTPVQAGVGYGLNALLGPKETTPTANNAPGTPNVPSPTPSAPLGKSVADLLSSGKVAQAAQSTPTTANIVDLTQISRETRPTPQDAVRLYYVEPIDQNRDELPEQMVLTTNLAEVQAVVNDMGGQARVLYLNETVKALDNRLQAAPEELRQQITKPGIEFLVPKSTLTVADVLYEPGMKRKESPVTTGQPVATSVPPSAPKLPQELAGAKPRYSYGEKKFTLAFESDVDRAAYILTQDKRSKRDSDYLGFVMRSTGLSEPLARAYGRRVRAAIKQQAAGAETRELSIPRLADKPMPVGKGKGKIRVEFPTEVEKTLYNVGRAYTTKKGIPTADLSLDDLSLSRGVPTDQTRAAAITYYKRVNAEAKKAERGANVMAPTQTELPQPPETAADIDEVSDQAMDGVVTIAKDVVVTPMIEKAQVLLQKWVKIFAPQMRIILAGTSEPGFAGNASTDGRGTIKIWLSGTNQSPMRMTFTLAHEFGHALVYHYLYHPAHSAKLAELRAEHQAFVARVPDMTIAEFFQEWSGMTPNERRDEILSLYDVKLDEPALHYIALRDEQHDLKLLNNRGPEALRRFRQMNPNGYTLDFNEYAAEQVARYIGKNRKDMLPETEAWVKEFLETMRDFFQRVIAKLFNQPRFEAWMEALRRGDPEWIGTPAKRTLSLPKEYQELDVDSRLKYSTKILDNLGKRATITKEAVSQQLRRTDVRKQEKELLTRVMATFPGPTMGRQEFIRAVQAEIVPLTQENTGRWKEYGLKEAGFDFIPHAPGLVAGTVDPLTHLWLSSIAVPPESNHFNHDHYFGHTRMFVLREPPIGGRAQTPTTGFIVEIQSDFAQHAKAALTEEQIAKWKREVEELQEQQRRLVELYRRHGLTPQEVLSELSNITGSSLSHYPVDVAWNLYNDTRDAVAARIYEIQAKLNSAVANDVFPSAWWELLIQEEVRTMADIGLRKVRVASADTAMAVERWPHQLRTWETDQEPILQMYDATQKGRVPFDYNTDPGVRNKADRAARGYYKNLIERMKAAPAVSFPVLNYTDHADIYQRYAVEIPQFLKKRYGAKLVEDSAGVAVESRTSGMLLHGDGRFTNTRTWWEFPIEPDQRDLPIQYYELDEANRETGEMLADLTETPEAPEVPAIMRLLPKTMFVSLQLNQAAKVLPQVAGIQLLRRAMQNLTNIKNQLMAGPNERIKQWYRINRDQKQRAEQFLKDQVNGGVHFTSLVQVVGEHNGQRMVRWEHQPTEAFRKEMQRRKISEAGAELILGVQNDFLLDLDVMERVVLRSIDKYFSSNPIAGRLRRVEAQKEFQKLREVPFFPDRRFGKWAVKIKTRKDYDVDGKRVKEGETVYWAKFETKWAMKRHLAKIQAQYGQEFEVYHEYIEDNVYVLRGLPRELLRTVREVLKLTPEQEENLKQLEYDYTKEGAFFKLLGKGKKGVGGGHSDLRRVYADYHWRTANLVAKLLYNSDINHALYALKTQADQLAQAGDTNHTLDILHERLRKTVDYVMRPQHEYEKLRAITSLWYLIAVPRAAVMNFTSVPVLGYSHLAAIYGDINAVRELTQAMADIWRSKWNPNTFTADEKAMFSRAHEDGVDDQSYAAEMASASTPSMMELTMPQWEWFQDSGASDAVKKTTWRIVNMGMKPFRLVETFNRRTMLLTTYRLARQAGAKPISSGDQAAYLAARDAVDYTQNEYNPWNRPPIFQGKQSLFLIFYSFVQNMAFFTLGGDKGWWRAWMVLFGLAGLQGLPFVDDLMTIINSVWTKLSGEKTDLRKEAREVAVAVGMNPDLLMHGMTHTMFGLGWDASYSVGFGQVIPGLEQAFSDGDFDTNAMRFLAEAGGPFSSLAVNMMRAIHDDNASAIMRFERMAPTFLRNVSRAGRMAADGVMTDNRGNVLVEGVTPWQLVGQLAGFTPTEKSTKQEELALARDERAWYVIRREHFMAMYHQARKADDTERLDAVKEAVEEFNDKVPYPELRITSESLFRSSRQRAKAEKAQQEGTTTERRYKHLYEELDPLFTGADEDEDEEE